MEHIIEIRRQDLAAMLSALADHLIAVDNVSPDIMERFAGIGQDMILRMMYDHDLTFNEGLLVLSIMLESMLSLDANHTCPKHLN